MDSENLRLSNRISKNKKAIQAYSTQQTMMPIGSMLIWTCEDLPAGWLLCDGTAVKRINYKGLFKAIGTTYGNGDGNTTFNLPNLKGKFPLGATGPLGVVGNAKTITPTSSQTPSSTSITVNFIIAYRDVKAPFKGDKGERGYQGAKGDKGDNAPLVRYQFSTDGTSWHLAFTSGDAYIRFSSDNGLTWSNSILFKGEQGIQGIQGEKGNKGDKGNTGDTGDKGVSLRIRGVWNTETEYKNDSSYIDVIEYSGSSYSCKVTHTNQEPPNATYWDLVAHKGDTGEKGEKGISFRHKGEWNSSTEYVKNSKYIDVVLSNGSSYSCKSTHTGQEPPNNTYWALVAHKGLDGTGTGDVRGPESSVDGEVAVFDSTTGKVIKGSVVKATNNGIMIDSENGEKGLRMGGTGNVSFVGRYSNYMSLYNHLNSSKEFKIPDSGEPTIGGNKVWHEGNDGSGSGLDADKLDGMEANSFTQSKVTGNGQDLNDLTQSGVYRLSGELANAPVAGLDWSQLLVLHGGYDTIAQVGINYSSQRMWVRAGNPPEIGGGGSWGTWQELWHSGNLNPLPKSGGTMTGNIAMSNKNITGVNLLAINDEGSGEGISFTGGGSGTTYLNRVDDENLRIVTPNGYLDLGPKNTSHCHIYTDRGTFYFNKKLLVNGDHVRLKYGSNRKSYTLSANTNLPLSISEGETVHFEVADRFDGDLCMYINGDTNKSNYKSIYCRSGGSVYTQRNFLTFGSSTSYGAHAQGKIFVLDGDVHISGQGLRGEGTARLGTFEIWNGTNSVSSIRFDKKVEITLTKVNYG